MGRGICQWGNQSINQWGNQSINKSMRESVNRGINQSNLWLDLNNSFCYSRILMYDNLLCI